MELHAKSFYSFGMGASHVHELLAQAGEYGYPALALTDANLCGALEFARLAASLGIKPITGGELTLADGSRLVLLARTRQGYANISRLFTLSNAADRREPRLDPARLADHSDGVVLLTGGRDGPLSRLLLDGRPGEARRLLHTYREWLGHDGVYVELQQNFLKGDTARNRELAALAHSAGVPMAATNDVHYHRPERYRLQHALAAARRNTTIERALPYIKPNNHLCLKPPACMKEIFRQCPEAIANTVRIAEQCFFNLATGLGYSLPDAAVPQGYTSVSYLRRLCLEATQRRYGSVSRQVRERLDEEFRLIERHGLAGLLLLYRERVLLAQEIMQEQGLVQPEIPIVERPPGRGRGSSVALLTGYLTGISHVDPLRWGLTLERFISEDTSLLPDIDLDFPRALRDELIRRVHRRFGPERAVLAGAVATYSAKGIVQDLGKALGLPREDLKQLSKQLHSHDGAGLREEMLALPAFRDRVDAPGWRELTELAPQLMSAPRSLGQHVGGMVLSGSAIPEMAPVRAGAMEGRHIMDWNKDSVVDANFTKIDLLSLPVLDQLDEALNLIERREGVRSDLSRTGAEDPAAYDMINAGRSKGVFLLQSPAQLKMAQRLKSRNLLDLAYQVSLIRPGVGGRAAPCPVRGALPPRGAVAVRPPIGGAGPGEGRRRHRLAGAGGAAHRGSGRHDRRPGRRDTVGLRRAQQRPSRRPAPPPLPGRGLGQRGAGRSGGKDIRQDKRPVHVPRKPLPRLRRHRVSGGLAAALPPGGVLCVAGQPAAHGLLPGGDPEAGRAAFWRPLPEPLRQPQRR